MLIALAGTDMRIELGAQLVEKFIEPCVRGPHSGIVRIHRHFRGSRLPRAKVSEDPAARVGRSVENTNGWASARRVCCRFGIRMRRHQLFNKG